MEMLSCEKLIAHPAKEMIGLSRMQDEECGGGTTSVIILNIHPVVIISAYNKALKQSLAIIKRISILINHSNDEEMLSLIKTSIGTKFVLKMIMVSKLWTSKDILNEIDRNLADAISVARNVVFKLTLVPGGGDGDFPGTLPHWNSGVIRMLTELRAKHATGNTHGKSTVQTFKTVIEAARMLLRIDDVVQTHTER
ncbi:hypothetical protein D9758_013378 [Tetrapyrgos nigripes]|uniref:Uncharacterized protein n=1 Tax=Tetrapyrgos nigripes TaxID=182062 RepID=A0A8H5CLF3_9AGAR|nr:hypothetical protein D9758_013378 [Tetrapyrgos nigripes]